VRKLHLEQHHNEDYRISDDADDHWIGIVCDENGDEIADFSNLIAERGFAFAKKHAQNWVAGISPRWLTSKFF
jgi:hypothetical protein